MGIYSVAVDISLNIKMFFRVAAKFNLPEPTTEDGIFYELNASQAKEWNEFGMNDDYEDPELILTKYAIHEHCSNYIYKLTQAAPEGKNRRAFLRKGSKKYRFAFC